MMLRIVFTLRVRLAGERVMPDRVLTANWIFVGFAGLICAAFIMRMAREEQMVVDAFGEEYREYMKRTGRVFPKI